MPLQGSLSFHPEILELPSTSPRSARRQGAMLPPLSATPLSPPPASCSMWHRHKAQGWLKPSLPLPQVFPGQQLWKTWSVSGLLGSLNPS